MSKADLIVTAFFRFCDLSGEVESLQQELLELSELRGQILLAAEGINGMVSGSRSALDALEERLESRAQLSNLEFKDSHCSYHPFPKWKVEIKDQIILYGDRFRPSKEHRHLSPQEWHDILESDEPVTVLDTRNRYETELGVFEGAVDPEIDKFTEFSDYLESCELPKDRKTLIYCTGGIRCEKAIMDMEEQGFTNVYQLHGGILKYLEEFPNERFEGECFVFDKRVAVGQKLEPSEKYWICPHCGDPGDLRMDCRQCQGEAKICQKCVAAKPVCGKDCLFHWKRVGCP